MGADSVPSASSTQIALFMVPLPVFLSLALGHPAARSVIAGAPVPRRPEGM